MHKHFIDSCCKHLGPEGVERIASCLDLLTDEQIWQQPSKSAVSIGNLCLHLHGNVRQWIVSGLGGAKDERVRDNEFSDHRTHSKDELVDQLRNTITEAQNVLRSLTIEQLEQDMRIQGFATNTTAAITHVVEHFSYHTGQITLLTKIATDADLGYYAKHNLNISNAE